MVGCPFIGFRFKRGCRFQWFRQRIGFFLAVKQNMRRLMKEAEPQMVIGLMSDSQLDDRLPR